jgi:hypothetical protein
MQTNKIYRIFEDQLVELQQIGKPIPNTFGKTGLNFNITKAYIKGQGFAKWVDVVDLKYPYSTFYWNNN